MMKDNFIPEQPEVGMLDVPFFEDVTAADGWHGHEMGKSIERLKEEITAAVNKLGGAVVFFQRGTFQVGKHRRLGFRLRFTISRQDGSVFPGQLDVAALPNKDLPRMRHTLEKRQQGTLRMALFMLRDMLVGLWYLQVLSPGYAGLLPWMLAPGSDKTLTELWTDSGLKALAPPAESDFMDGEIVDSAP